jgi:hypothetical protein
MDKYQKSIQALKSNYPSENYTMLREAVDIAIEVLTEKSESLTENLDHLTRKEII